MTDNEIIKALEYCKDCSANLNTEIVELIASQQKEIESLQKALFKQEDTMQIIAKEKQQYFDELQTTKSESIKEFAERLKEIANTRLLLTLDPRLERKYVNVDEIDNLVKEMIGKDNE